jgi:hypothetical protein
MLARNKNPANGDDCCGGANIDNSSANLCTSVAPATNVVALRGGADGARLASDARPIGAPLGHGCRLDADRGRCAVRPRRRARASGRHNSVRELRQ